MMYKIRTRFQLKLETVVALLIICCSLNAQVPAAAPDWMTYSNPSDGFSVSFPAAPEVSNQHLSTESGALELHAYLVSVGTAALYVGVSDYGASAQGRDPETILAGAEKGAVDNIKAHTTAEHKIILGSYPGLEFEAENGTLHFDARLYLVGTTLYQMLVEAPVSDRFADTDRFLDSFQLISRVGK